MEVNECQMHACLLQTLDYFMLCLLLVNESNLLGQVQMLMGHQTQRGFLPLPEDVVWSQCSMGSLLHVLDEARAGEGGNGLKVFATLESPE